MPAPESSPPNTDDLAAEVEEIDAYLACLEEQPAPLLEVADLMHVREMRRAREAAMSVLFLDTLEEIQSLPAHPC